MPRRILSRRSLPAASLGLLLLLVACQPRLPQLAGTWQIEPQPVVLYATQAWLHTRWHFAPTQNATHALTLTQWCSRDRTGRDTLWRRSAVGHIILDYAHPSAADTTWAAALMITATRHRAPLLTANSTGADSLALLQQVSALTAASFPQSTRSRADVKRRGPELWLRIRPTLVPTPAAVLATDSGYIRLRSIALNPPTP